MLLLTMIAGALAAPVAPAPSWEATLDRVADAVVAIEVTGTRDFDTEGASSSVGTGFVVDAARGLILTNRHMVHAGPVTARAVFLDNEEVHLEPIYRDPVHDFGFYRFDPAEVRYQDLVELELAPEAAKVGMEIRVVGNDAGEKLAILDGTLARLDRNAPVYARGGYNDFNTFYYQAASNTSGGSSGSPVIDVSGRVVALNAGGRTEAASSFYLPLDRVERALDLVREGREVPRGSLLTTFSWEAWQDVDRLGLSEATEARVRATFPSHSGMLVVSRVLPGGPADGKLRPGDVLVSLDGRLVDGFVDLEAVLDASVGGRVTLGLERLGAAVEVELAVTDLASVTPATYLEVGRAVLHELSYQVARSFELPVAGVYVATPGFLLAPGGVGATHLITHVDGVPVPTLDAAQRELEAKADGQRVRVRHAPAGQIREVREAIVTMDRTWFPMRRCTLEPASGRWPCADSPPPPPRPDPAPVTATLPTTGDRTARRVAQALVLAEFQIPYSTAGVAGTTFVGTGVVFDATRGLVLVDRDTVPVALGTLSLTFGGTVRVPGEVVWLHPQHNVAVVRYDPADVGGLDVGEIALETRWPKKGEKLRLVGLDRTGALVSDEGEVERVDALGIEPSSTPRYRAINVEAISLARVDVSSGGVLLDRKGRAVALWASFFYPERKDAFFYGLPGAYLADALAELRAGRTPVVRELGVELRLRSLADARERGLSDDRLRELVGTGVDSPWALEVVRVDASTPAAGLLRETDLLLLADGRPLSRMRDIAGLLDQDATHLLVLRDGVETQVPLPLARRSGEGVREVLLWAGTIVHAPHEAIALDKGQPQHGAYVGWYWYGSPGVRDGVRPTRRIVRVDDQEIADLDAFVAAVTDRDPSRPVVLTLVDLDGTTQVRAVEQDLDYWPTELLRWEDGAWRRTRIAP